MTDTLRNPEGCLDAESIAALIDGRLSPDARERAHQHLASCQECYALVRDLVQTWPDLGASEGTRAADGAVVPIAAGRRPRRWIVGAALAAAAGLVVWLWLPGRTGMDVQRPELSTLVAAVGSTRSLDGRLTGGFSWGPLDTGMRAGTTGRAAPEVEIAAAELEQAVNRDRSAPNVAAFGSSRLVLGDIANGVAALEEAVALEPRRAGYWSDLAAAHLADAEQPGRDAALPRALDAAESALAIDPELPEALFNKAVALERLGMVEQARDGWTRYLATQDDPRWKAEAERRLQALAVPPAAGTGSDVEPLRQRIYGEGLRAWIESGADDARAAAALLRLRGLVADLERQSRDAMPRDVLVSLERGSGEGAARTAAAAAHEAFLRAQGAMDRDEFTVADEAFDRARPELARLESPLLLTARYHNAVIAYRRRATDEAFSQLTALAEDVRPHGYPALLGRVEWMLGLVQGLRGNPRASDEHYVAAIAAFDAAGEPTNAASVRNLLAVNLERVGDPWTAWSLRRDALARSSRPGVLLSAALGAANRGWRRAALVFTDAALVAAKKAESAPNIADVLRIEASIRADLDGPAAMAPLIDEARRLVSSRQEPAWARVRAEIALAVAQSATDAQLAEGIQSASEAIAYFQSTGGAGRLPQVYAIRARLHRRAGRSGDAQQDVRAGLEALAVQRRNLPAGTSQATFEAVEHDLLEELVALATSREAAEAAFPLVDASRGRDVVGGERAPLTPQALGTALPDRTAFVSFLVADQTTYVWTVTNATHAFDRIEVDRASLDALVRGVTPPRDDPDAANRLSRLLLGRPGQSMAEDIDTLVVVPDGPLRAVPFARLALPDGRTLVASSSIVIAPSAAAWLESGRRVARGRPTHAPVLAVGNPAFDPHEYPTLRGLPHADAEAAAVAGRYTRAPLLLRGPEATRAVLLRELPRARIVHFAGHAVSDPWTADASFLALAGPRPSRLTAADVRRLDLAQMQLVVLAACETATSGGAPGFDSPLSLARAFLAAGVPQVVGSLWLASDRASRALFDAFHADYAESGDAARALQRAQQALAHSPDPSLNAPRQWAGFVLMGGSSGSRLTTDDQQRRSGAGDE